jgi:hypothetical protein
MLLVPGWVIEPREGFYDGASAATATSTAGTTGASAQPSVVAEGRKIFRFSFV